VLAASSGQAPVLSLTINRKERRTRKARARFDVRVRAEGAPESSLSSSIPLTR
jgi:hypothetical protein